MDTETIVLIWTLIVLFFTLLVLIWQTWLNRMEMRKSAIRDIYARWLEINKLEVQHPELHKMFMDVKMLKELGSLPEDELRRRSLSLFIFDQFAMIYNLGERESIYLKIDPYFRKMFKKGAILNWWSDFIDKKRTLLDINESYIRRIMTNPEVIKCWIDYKLGETWKGSKYFDYINNLITSTQNCPGGDVLSRICYKEGKNIIQTYDEAAEEYSKAFFNPETLQAEVHYLEKFLSFLGKRGKILDVGCGPGIETEFFSTRGFEYEGVDLSPNMIQIAKRKNPGATFKVMDIHRLEYKDDSIDGIIALESLVHFPKDDIHAIVLNLYRILKSEGVLLLALQSGEGEKLIPFPFKKESKLPLTLFTENEIKKLLHECGFEVMYTTVRKPVPMEYEYNKLVVIAKKK